MSKIIDGKYISKVIKNDIRAYIGLLKSENKRVPHLATILVGNDPASIKYVNSKNKDCEEVGIKTTHIHLDENITEEELMDKIFTLNLDNHIDGILVQLPLPSHIDDKRIMNNIFPSKDVDCFHPVNVGNMYIGNSKLLPCTPKGIIRILEYIEFEYMYESLKGLKAVVIGRSNIVGKPIAKLLMDKDMTVTICHSKTQNIIDEVKQADIVIAAVGKPKMIKSDWLKEGAIVIDAGINVDENGKLCGDVDLEDVIDKVKFITPVPGGVGLLTRAMLLENTMIAYMEKNKII